MSSAKTPSIGLALGGGGARGLAHIPALEALDELGVKPVHIAGTSIGALMGAGYASGMTGREIRHYAEELLGDTRKLAGKLMELRPQRFSELFERGSMLTGQLDAERIVNLLAPASVPQEFADLVTPLSVIATDFYGWREQVISNGNLRRAVAASLALPIMFRPVAVNGRVLIDGGIVNPLPVDQLADTDFVIAVDVVGGPEQRSDRPVPSMAETMFGATQILMQSIIAEKLRHDKTDILLKPEINQFRVLDFLKVREILKAAEPIKDEMKRQIEAKLSGV
jgi:NTE family protein